MNELINKIKMYGIEFTLMLLDVMQHLCKEENKYFSIVEILSEINKKNDKEQLKTSSKSIKKRIRYALFNLEKINKIEKLEQIDDKKKVLFYKFKIKIK